MGERTIGVGDMNAPDARVGNYYPTPSGFHGEGGYSLSGKMEVEAGMRKRRGLLLVEAKIANRLEVPVEKIEMCVRYDSADFSVISGGPA